MRSLLFVPADSPKKLDRAAAAGADALIVDLEDSVAPARKPLAREAAAEFLRARRAAADAPVLIVRINALETGLADADLEAVVPTAPDLIMLPKARGRAAVAELDAKLTAQEALHARPDGGIGILPIATETAESLFLSGTYRGASVRLRALTWGAEDLSADIGAETNRDEAGLFTDPYRIARAFCLLGAAAAEVPAIDTVFVDFRDPAGLRAEAEAARRDGFDGKMAIHPDQVAIINEVFTPTAEAIAQSERIVAAFAADPGAGVVGIDGRMVDRPHLRRAERLLARAGRARP